MIRPRRAVAPALLFATLLTLLLAGCGGVPSQPAVSGPVLTAEPRPVPEPPPSPAAPGQEHPDGVARLLAYAERVRTTPPSEMAAEIERQTQPTGPAERQAQLAIALAQTRQSADLARAQSLLRGLLAQTDPESLALRPLTQLLAAQYTEQRRLEEQIDRQSQQLRDSQRRIEQLSERLEAVRAVERSLPPRPAPGSSHSSRSRGNPVPDEWKLR